MDRPHLIVLAGPNGAGKSSAAPALLNETLGITEFVNADVIAAGLSAFEPERVALEAGRLMLQRIHELAEQRIDFAFETTLASRSFAPWIAGLVQSGYIFDLIYLWLRSADHAVSRVRDRVLKGGHNVPEETIRRRYDRGITNFFRLYRPLAASWRVYDNADSSGLSLIASGGAAVAETVVNQDMWDKIKQSAK